MLKRQVERLTALVAEMLDVSRITGGGLQLVLGSVDLRDIVREVLDRFDLEIQRRHVTREGERAGPGAWDMGCRPHRSGHYEPDLERAQVRGRAPHRGLGPRRGVAGRRRCSRPWDWDPGG